MPPIITKQNLEAGIEFWRREKKGWPPDFHNQLYRELYDLKQGGLIPQWWSSIVDTLWNWRAIRPKTKAYILDRGLERLEQLEIEYRKLLNLCSGQEPGILDTRWNEVSELYEVAWSIKGVESPVFASKLCHFLLPNCFPVIDHAVVGVNGTYSDYRRSCSNAWSNCEDRNALIDTMRSAVGDEVIPQFPYLTKIVELCSIGQRVLAECKLDGGATRP